MKNWGQTATPAWGQLSSRARDELRFSQSPILHRQATASILEIELPMSVLWLRTAAALYGCGLLYA
ncbi:MAG: hypothetical protein ACRD5Z_00155, partial [Bryobacteraceae bacterium]